MRESRKTALFAAVAVAAAVATWTTRPHANQSVGTVERNRPLFPQLTDPNAARSLEVIRFDEQSATPRAFKVVNQGGRWTIPSQFDYPADARDQLATVAAAIITLRVQDVVSASTSDYARYGVVDPLAIGVPGVGGRATRITIRGENERLLADVLLGRTLAGHDDIRYVRLPDQRTVYSTRVGDVNASIRFADWIDPDLLQLDRQTVDAVNIVNYSLDGQDGTVHPREALLLRRRGDDEWRLDDSAPGETVDPAAMQRLIDNLAGLRIVGVFPKPPGISAVLSPTSQSAAITTADRDDLAHKGFYLTRDGRLLSNQGEVIIHSTTGVFYTLRFGQVAPPEPEPITPAQKDAGEPAVPRENRYLFIMTAFDPTAAGRDAAALDAARQRASVLSQRFAPWYYVISADRFEEIRVQRKDLLKKVRR